MKKTLPVIAAAFGLALGVFPALNAQAATFSAPSLTAPVRDGPSLSVKPCSATRAPKMARTAFRGTRPGPCCQPGATTCAELLSTTRMQLPRRPART